MTSKSYAKVNIFLKIAGKRDSYHELASRFVRVLNLYDTITFEPYTSDEFILEGNFGCDTKKNTIYKAYEILKQNYPCVEDYFKNHKVLVEKTIPEFAGLGGGSSNCATFMIMINQACNLKLSKDQLSQIGATIGADVPFFIYEYNSANVTGIGEIVNKFDEPILDIEVVTPQIKCDTGAIFKEFRKHYYQEITKTEADKLLNMQSIDILKLLSIEEANDLYLPAIRVSSDLEIQNLKLSINHYFSGSGSSFFKVNGVK